MQSHYHYYLGLDRKRNSGVNISMSKNYHFLVFFNQIPSFVLITTLICNLVYCSNHANLLGCWAMFWHTVRQARIMNWLLPEAKSVYWSLHQMKGLGNMSSIKVVMCQMQKRWWYHPWHNSLARLLISSHEASMKWQTLCRWCNHVISNTKMYYFIKIPRGSTESESALL